MLTITGRPCGQVMGLRQRKRSSISLFISAGDSSLPDLMEPRQARSFRMSSLSLEAGLALPDKKRSLNRSCTLSALSR